MRILLSSSLSLLLSLHFTTIHTITRFYVQIIHILGHNLFPCFPEHVLEKGDDRVKRVIMEVE